MNAMTIATAVAPDELALGRVQGYPVGNKDNCHFDESVLIGSYSNMDAINHTKTVQAPSSARPLRQASLPQDFRYRIPSLTANGIVFGDESFSVDDYLRRQRVTGLLILKDDAVLFERYQYERNASHRFAGFSMTKSITSLAIGCALAEGRIASLDDPVGKYVSELRQHLYGDISIRHVLQMASGIRFSEIMDTRDDLKLFFTLAEEHGLISAIRLFNESEAEPGSRFNYATIDTYVLGILLSCVLDTSLSEYVSQKIWQPMGAESDAKWIVDKVDLEYAGSGFNATLRDYARLGMLLANDGMRDGVQILPRDYLYEATDWTRHRSIFQPMRGIGIFGYGFQFWTFPGEARRFAMVGIRGQVVYVDTASKLVLVQTAVAREFEFYTRDPMGMELGGLWRCLIDAYASGNG